MDKGVKEFLKEAQRSPEAFAAFKNQVLVGGRLVQKGLWALVGRPELNVLRAHPGTTGFQRPGGQSGQG